MGSKGVLSSAAVGVSLIAASAVLAVGVAAQIGFRGFDAARSASTSKSVAVDDHGEAREAGAPAKPRAAVIGSAARPARAAPSRPARRRTVRRTARRSAGKVSPRSGLPAPAKRRVPAHAPVTRAPQDEPAGETAAKAPTASGRPVGKVVDDVTGAVGAAAEKPVEAVGDVLLDLRDVLP